MNSIGEVSNSIAWICAISILSVIILFINIQTWNATRSCILSVHTHYFSNWEGDDFVHGGRMLAVDLVVQGLVYVSPNRNILKSSLSYGTGYMYSTL